MKHMPRISAVLFILWGLLHVAGGSMMLLAWASSPADFLAMIGTGPAATPLAAAAVLPPQAVGVLGYHAFNLVLFGCIAVFTGMGQWKGNRLAVWTSIILVGAVDAGLVLFHLVPGQMNVTDAIPGLALFAAGSITGVIGLVTSAEGAARA